MSNTRSIQYLGSRSDCLCIGQPLQTARSYLCFTLCCVIADVNIWIEAKAELLALFEAVVYVGRLFVQLTLWHGASIISLLMREFGGDLLLSVPLSSSCSAWCGASPLRGDCRHESHK